MNRELLNFDSLIELLDYFRTEEVCRAALAQARWGNNPTCPHCEVEGAYITKRGYRCANKDCRKDFTVTTGSIFENTKIPLRKWYGAMYLVTAHKKGISSYQIKRDLKVSQKTAWFMMHRVRAILVQDAPEMLDDIVEVDETYIGGKIGNRHVSKRKNLSVSGTSHTHKTAVLGMVERNGQLITKVVVDAKKHIVLPILKEVIAKGSTIHTDSAHMYKTLRGEYKHEFINHQKDEYVRGNVHTNTIEGVWSLLKRGITGIYHQVTPKHLHRYCVEFTYRYNSRDITDCERFVLALSHTEKRLKYSQLIAKI